MQIPDAFADAFEVGGVHDEALAADVDWVVLLERCTQIPQENNNWCWLSAGQTIDHFYRGSTITQCDVARDYVGEDTCTPDCSGCTGTGELASLLEARSLLAGPIERDVAFDRVVAELSKADPAPVCCHLDRPNGHFLVLYGYADNPPRVAIRDPEFGDPQWQVFDDFVSAYKNGGVWDQTYFTQNG